MLAHPLGKARRVRLELQVRTVDPDQLREVIDPEHAGIM
jgi:hypothetical protein